MVLSFLSKFLNVLNIFYSYCYWDELHLICVFFYAFQFFSLSNIEKLLQISMHKTSLLPQLKKCLQCQIINLFLDLYELDLDLYHFYDRCSLRKEKIKLVFFCFVIGIFQIFLQLKVYVSLEVVLLIIIFFWKEVLRFLVLILSKQLWNFFKLILWSELQVLINTMLSLLSV